MSTARLWLEDTEIDWSRAPRAAVVRPTPSARPERRGPARPGKLALAGALAAVAVLGIASVERDAPRTAPPPLATGAAAPAGRTGTGVSPVTLDAIARCESRGDPTAVSPDGRYRGKYQFDLATWRSVGGSGDPALAAEAEQDRRARALAAERGTQPWPVCGPAVSGQ